MAYKDLPYDLLEKYDRAVPRYTSFPTAVHFTHDISQAYVSDLLSGLGAGEKVSLYIHIPFCRYLCHYCGCHTRAVNSYRPVRNYLSSLQREIEKIQDSVVYLRKCGIQNINFDLMTGLPLQTAGNVRLNAERAVSLSPDRLAVFAYAHVPWMKKHQKLLEKYPLPGPQERFEMNSIMKDVLSEGGYNPIGIDHYAHILDPLYKARETGRLRRNFQGYTSDETKTVIGFGLSSISSFTGAYIQNTADPKEYRDAVQDNRFPVKRGRILTRADIRRRHFIERIMCNFELDMNEVEQTDYNSDRLEELEKDDIIDLNAGRLRIPETGKPFTRIVASCFDPYYQMKESRHARAV